MIQAGTNELVGGFKGVGSSVFLLKTFQVYHCYIFIHSVLYLSFSWPAFKNWQNKPFLSCDFSDELDSHCCKNLLVD